MKPTELIKSVISSGEHIENLHSIETELLRRRRVGKFGGISAAIALLWAIVQALFEASEAGLLSSMGNLLSPEHWGDFIRNISPYEVLTVVILATGFGIYFLSRWTSIMLKESEEPFRYTFWIEPFEPVPDTPADRFKLKDADRFALLNFDLKERLNKRIMRFSLINYPQLSDQGKMSLTSHIHICGKYALREEEKEKWIVHVMPRIRIGPPGNPETLAEPVKYLLTNLPHENKNEKRSEVSTDSDQSDRPGEQKNSVERDLNADKYNQIVERVYSSIATEIYRQIESDVKEKIELFPTSYLKANALYREAEDFARSNTIDAYDRAIDLYEEARRSFEPTFIHELGSPKHIHLQAKIRTGHAKCLIYKWVLSALSGRSANPLFEIPNDLNEMIENLRKLNNRINPNRNLKTLKRHDENTEEIKKTRKENRLKTILTYLTIPKYNWSSLNYSRHTLEEQRQTLFDAFVVAALAYYYLGATEEAEEYLKDAKAIDPERSERNPLYLLAAGAIQPELEKEIHLFRLAAEISPDFQIAQYLLAYYSEMWFRTGNEITRTRAGVAIKEYEEVLRINPGNIAAQSSLGYIYWLLEKFQDGERCLEDGREIKATDRQTYIGELNYNLARIAAEKGDMNDSYNFYIQAISDDPGICAHSVTASKRATTPFYDYIDSEMLDRYQRFKRNVEKNIESIVSSFYPDDLSDLKSFVDRLKEEKDSVSRYLKNEFSDFTLRKIEEYQGSEPETEQLKKALSDELNRLIQRKSFYGGICNTEGALSSEEISELLQGKPHPDLKKAEEIILGSGITVPVHNHDGEIHSPILARILIEKHYPNSFVRSLDDSGRVDRKRKMYEIYKDEDKTEIISSTLDVVYRFVLNDYGNACFNYFLRQGLEQRDALEKAVYAYSKAVSGDAANKVLYDNLFKVIYYNLSISYEWKGDIENARAQLNEIEKIGGPTWTTGEIALIQSLLRQRYEEIKNKEDQKKPLISEINKYRSKREEILSRIEKLQQEERKRISPTLQIGSGINAASTSSPGDGGESGSPGHIGSLVARPKETPEFRSVERELSSLNSELEQYERQKIDLDEDIKKLREEIQNQVTECVNKIIERTKLSSLYHGLEFDHSGQGVDKLLSEEVKNYRLDVNDVEALRVWAEIVSYSDQYELIGSTEAQFDALADKSELYNIFNKKGDTPSDEIVVLNDTEEIEILDTRKKTIYKLQKEDRIRTYEDENKDDKGDREIDKINLYKNKSFTASQSLFNYILREYYPNNFDVIFVLREMYRRMYSRFLTKLLENGSTAQEEARAQLDKDINEFSLEYERKMDPIVNNWVKTDPDNYLYKIYLGDTYNSVGNIYFEAGDYENAKSYYEKAIEKNRESDVYHSNLRLATENQALVFNEKGNDFFRDGNYEESLEFYKKAIEHDPGTPIFRSNLILAYTNLNRNEEAEREYEKALEVDPDNPVYRNELGNAFYQNADYEKAVENHTKAVEITTEEGDELELYRLNLARSYNQLGNNFFIKADYENALEHYKKAIQHDPKTAIYRSNLILSYTHSKRYEDAEREYEKAVQIDPNNPSYRSELGEAFYQNAEYLKSVENYEKAILMTDVESDEIEGYHSRLALAYNQIGNGFFRDGDNEKAAEQYEKAIQNDPKTPIFRSNLILAYANLNRNEEAEREYEKALEVDPDNPMYRNELGDALYENGDYKKAVENYQHAIDKEPDEAVYHSNLARAYNQLGNNLFVESDYESAVEYFKNAIQHDPKTSIYRSNLILSYTYLKRFEEAENEYEKAVQIDPDNPSYRSDLADAFFQNGDYARAGEQFIRAIEINPQEPSYISRLAEVCILLEHTNKDKAIALLESGSEYSPGDTDLKEAMKRLKHQPAELD